MSQQSKRMFNILDEQTCKSQYVMYLMEGILCKIQYVVKSKTPFNLRLNNQRKDFNNLKAIPAGCQFKIHGHNFMKREVYSYRVVN